MEQDEDLKPLTEKEIVEKIKNLSGWSFINNKLSKTFLFPSFTVGIDLLSKLAPFCDTIDHHPDILISYKKFNFELTRYSIGGKVTKRDFIVAHRIQCLHDLNTNKNTAN